MCLRRPRRPGVHHDPGGAGPPAVGHGGPVTGPPRASPASAPWVRRLPDRSAARAAGRCPAGLTRHSIRPDRGPSCGTGDPCHAVLRIRSAAGPRRPAPRTRRPPTGSSHHTASGTPPTVESRWCPQDVEEEGPGPAGPTNVAPRSRRLRPAPRRRRAVSTAAATGGPSGVPPRRGRRPSPRLRPGRRRRAGGRTPGTRAVTGAWACDHVRAGGARPAVVDPHSVNALGVRGSSRFTAESHPAFPLTHDALSKGAFRAGDDAWRQHGDRALEILRPLTRIAGHPRHHAEVDHGLRRRLEQPPCLCGAALRASTLQDDDGDDGRQDTAPREQPGRDRAGNEAPEARTQSECVTRRTL